MVSNIMTTMDFLSQVQQLKEAAEELETSRNLRSKFMTEYWKYALNEVKASRNKDEIYLDSPETRRKKIAAEEKRKTNGNGNLTEETTSRGGRNAAKKALEAISAGNKFLGNKKLRRPTEFDDKNTDGRKKRLLMEEKNEEAVLSSAKSKQTKTESFSEKDSKVSSPLGNEEDVNDAEVTLKLSPKSEQCVLEVEEAHNDIEVDKHEHTLVCSEADMFSPAGEETSTVDRQTNQCPTHSPIKTNRLNMSPVIMLERIDLEKELEELKRQKNEEVVNRGTDGIVEHFNHSSSEKEGKDPGISFKNARETMTVENHEGVTYIVPSNSENNVEEHETCEEQTPAKLNSKTSSENWLEEIMKNKDNEQNVARPPNLECKEESSNKNLRESPEKEARAEDIARKTYQCPQSEPNFRSRTRVKEIVKMLENEDPKCESLSSKKERPVISKKKIHCSEDFKENSTPMTRALQRGISSETKGPKGKPLSTKNRIYVPYSGKQQLSSVVTKVSGLKVVNKIAVEEVEQKRREEEMKRRKQKVEEAKKNKEELMKAKREELKRKREYKIKKVVATREAVEKEKLENLAKMEKEKEERERLKKAEMEKAKEELLRKKQINQQKAQEAEERRLKEENARLARLRELEEEQKRQAEIKVKQQEEAEKLLHQRKLEEEMRAKENPKNRKQGPEKPKNKNNISDDSNSYDITPHKIEREPLPLKDEEDYCLDDLNIEDSEDEGNPRKKIPNWAQKSERNFTLKVQSYIPESLISSCFVCPSKTPNLREFFGKYTRDRVRTSSAVWRSPPRLQQY